MTGLGRFARWIAPGGAVAGAAAYVAERASHDYQLVRWRVPARILGSPLMNPAHPAPTHPTPGHPAPGRDATGDNGTAAAPPTTPGHPTPGTTRPLRVLHLSDTHLYRGREDLVAWLRRLAARAGQDFDFVVLTGDMLATSFGDAHLATRAFTPLVASGIPGAYVFGAHDYYANRMGNPLRYLVKGMTGRFSGARGSGQGGFPKPSGESDRRMGMPGARGDAGSRAGTRDGVRGEFGRVFRDFLAQSPWVDLTNRQAVVSVAGYRVELAGVDDPHIGGDSFPGFPGLLGLPAAGASGTGVADTGGGAARGGASPRADSLGATANFDAAGAGEPAGNRGRLRLGLAHAPYARVLDSFDAAGADLVFCGHTHGGQVCWPGGRALVTNCDLDPQFASGVFSWAGGRPVAGLEPGLMRVSVSPGLGTSPFTPWRVFCPPCAFLVELD